ncbi:MAG: TMEM175 family protein [Caulobacterales bacterium]
MLHPESVGEGAGGRLIDRMVFFRDAVFAIVLTLLILELRPPEGENLSGDALWHAVLADSQTFFAFTVSFALVSVFWAAHMRIMRNLRVFDWWFAVINLFFLFSIALIPYISALLGAHLSNPVSLEVDGGVMIAASVAQVALWTAVSWGRGRLTSGIDTVRA